jgi:hypothetical protein
MCCMMARKMLLRWSVWRRRSREERIVCGFFFCIYFQLGFNSLVVLVIAVHLTPLKLHPMFY